MRMLRCGASLCDILSQEIIEDTNENLWSSLDAALRAAHALWGLYFVFTLGTPKGPFLDFCHLGELK